MQDIIRLLVKANRPSSAQMMTFDIHHPDVVPLITAKREDGRFRQFNISILISKDFMAAVEAGSEWEFSFPVTQGAYSEELDKQGEYIYREFPITKNYVVNAEGLVACDRYGSMPANELYDMIMDSTYNYSEPGFILIDEINELNTLYWCENIRATNPCVPGHVRLHNSNGLSTALSLYKGNDLLELTVDNGTLGEAPGTTIRTGVPVFKTDESARVYKVETEDGYSMESTLWHEYYSTRGKLTLSKLKVGDDLLLQSGAGQWGEHGDELLGKILAYISILPVVESVEDFSMPDSVASELFKFIIATYVSTESTTEIAKYSAYDPNNIFSNKELNGILNETSDVMVPGFMWGATRVCTVEWIATVLNNTAVFKLDGIESTIELQADNLEFLQSLQLLLINFGIKSSIVNGGTLVIKGLHAASYLDIFNFTGTGSAQADTWFITSERPIVLENLSRIKTITYVGMSPVYDTTQADHNSVIFNGFVTGQCGEQFASLKTFR